MSARLETNFVKTKYINPPIASLPLIFSNCFNFLNKFFLAIKQNLEVVENKKVMITSKLEKNLKNLWRYYFKHELNLKPSLFHLKIKPLTFSRINFAV